MSVFEFEKAKDPIRVAKFLDTLGLKQEKPSLTYLNTLIKNHQEKIPFENFSRIVDFHYYQETLPPIEDYVDRLSQGYGGVCWTLARGFAWLLNQLDFEVSYQYMSPGHLCLQVIIDRKEYYADVGYGAPIFKAYPITTNFELNCAHEMFFYKANGSEITIKRDPGPTKTMHLDYYSPETIEARFCERNIWGESRFLSTLFIIKYINGKYVKLNGNTLIDFRSGIEEKTEFSDEEVLTALKNIFAIDTKKYLEAKHLLLAKNSL